MTWFGLVCFPPLLLILCVLFPLCCAIRTLQWDTDPSVLQLQSDSELGYMSALLLLLSLFPGYGCVERPEPSLLLLFSPLLNFQFDKVYFLLSVCLLQLRLEESLSLWKTPQKDGFWPPPLLIPSIAKQHSPKWKLWAYRHASASRWGAQVLWWQMSLTGSSPSSPWLTSYLKLIFVYNQYENVVSCLLPFHLFGNSQLAFNLNPVWGYKDSC